MKKSRIYTRGGDAGETSLVSGKRLSKSNSQIDLYGDVDSLNSHLGYFSSLIETEDNGKSKNILVFFDKIQNTLFDLGSLLACEPENWEKFKLPMLDASLILEMEELIDQLDSELKPLKNFILPGGVPAAAYGHVVRTNCRMLERKLIAYSLAPAIVPDHSIQLLNRMSDFFFVVSRYLNMINKKPEILWGSSN